MRILLMLGDFLILLVESGFISPSRPSRLCLSSQGWVLAPLSLSEEGPPRRKEGCWDP